VRRHDDTNTAAMTLARVTEGAATVPRLRRTRRVIRVGLALAGTGGLVGVIALLLVAAPDARKEAPASSRDQGARIEVRVVPLVGSGLSPDRAAGRFAQVVVARGRDRGADDIDVAAHSDGRVSIVVPKVGAATPSEFLVVAPTVAVYDLDATFIRRGDTVSLIDDAVRRAPGRESGTFYLVEGRSRTTAIPQFYNTPAEARAAWGPVGSRDVVGVPRGFVVAADGYRGRDSATLLRDEPIVSAAGIASASVNRRGDLELSLADRRMIQSARVRRLLVVTGGRAIAEVGSQGIARARVTGTLAVPVPRGVVPYSTLDARQIADRLIAGGLDVAVELLDSQAVGKAKRFGTRPDPVSSGVLARFTEAADANGREEIRPDSIRTVLRIPRMRSWADQERTVEGPHEVYTALTVQGREHAVIAGPDGYVGPAPWCALDVEAPRLKVCGGLGLVDGRPGLLGRARPTVRRLVLAHRDGSTREGRVANGWFVASFDRGKEPVALLGYDVSGRLIARDRILRGPTPGG
jgi:hypothetical protein